MLEEISRYKIGELKKAGHFDENNVCKHCKGNTKAQIVGILLIDTYNAMIFHLESEHNIIVP